MPTRLMPDLIDRLEKTSPLMVLDVGFGVHETVEYFGDRRCRLHFAGLHETVSVPPAHKLKTPFGQMIDKVAQEEAMYAAWLEKFQAAMNFEPGTCFDLCLFWDFCNYLDDLVLKAFAEALAPYVGATTLGHAYILLKPEPSVLNREYGVLARDQISVRPGHHGNLPSYPRPQARATSMLKGFAVNHSVLRRDGLLEIALKSGL